MLVNQFSVNPFDHKQTLDDEIFERMPCGIIILNAEGNVIRFNKAASSLLCCELSDALWVDVIHKAFAPKEDDGCEISLVDGRRVSVAISSLESLPGEIIILTDLTSTRQYEQAKANQMHLMSIGRMTAQLAHQIRTPLSSAVLYTDHISHHPQNEVKIEKWVKQIQACHESIEKQIKDLLLFARGDILDMSPINLYEWGKRLENLALSLVKSKLIKLKVINQLPNKEHYLHEESLLGAVLNLLQNAEHASAKNVVLTLQLVPTNVLVIQVVDDGCGMSEEIKAQAFSPFFTTKAQGTGLGLAVVKSVVKAHQGEVSLETSIQKGCCVTLKLPSNQ